MLHVEVSKMWSKGLVTVYTDAMAMYDFATNSLAKYGKHLKLDDGILRRVNQEGRKGNSYHSWKVVKVEREESLEARELTLGTEYGIYIQKEDKVLPHVFTGVDLQTETYTFAPLTEGHPNIKATSNSLPHVYPKGMKKHAAVRKIILESVRKNSRGGYAQEIMFMKDIQDKKVCLGLNVSVFVRFTV